jgi:hypothetical protein
MMKNKKAVVPCFEADKDYCHRNRIVNYVNNVHSNEFDVVIKKNSRYS